MTTNRRPKHLEALRYSLERMARQVDHERLQIIQGYYRVPREEMGDIAQAAAKLESEARLLMEELAPRPKQRRQDPAGAE